MNNAKRNMDTWATLHQKWTTLANISKVEFTILKDPEDESRVLAIDVAQNINGEWVVQTVQRQPKEAYPLVGIKGLTLDQLADLAAIVVDTVTNPITGQETHDEELHLVMKRISPETSEIYGHVISKSGEKIGIRANYQHYYVINEILEQRSKIMNEEYSEVQLHRKSEDSGRIYFQFIPARDGS